MRIGRAIGELLAYEADYLLAVWRRQVREIDVEAFAELMMSDYSVGTNLMPVRQTKVERHL
jgi:hypothetical protein